MFQHKGGVNNARGCFARGIAGRSSTAAGREMVCFPSPAAALATINEWSEEWLLTQQIQPSLALHALHIMTGRGEVLDLTSSHFFVGVCNRSARADRLSFKKLKRAGDS
jgi:hypothetical protein